ncbi:hypothetical protein J7E90_00340 [Streptomyces sp. ISL-111]|nr:hypothetical protein [Streptomyces sp. ISL-111]
MTATAKDPCAAEEADTEGPTTPAAVKAATDGVSVLVSWVSPAGRV